MALEQAFKIGWIKRHRHAFFLGAISSMIGLVSALFIFPSNVDLMSVAFTSILLIPSLTLLLREEETKERKEDRLSLKLLFTDHKDIFKVYIFAFLGIFTTYILITLLFPISSVQRSFAAQLNTVGIYGFASSDNTLTSLILNNMIVIIVCFVLSLIYGAGSVIFLTWNASVWGVVFGYFILQAYTNTVQSIYSTGILILTFLPHMVTESTAYVGAAIVGGVLSKAVFREKFFSKKFYRIFVDSLVLLVLCFILVIIAGVIEVKFFGKIA